MKLNEIKMEVWPVSKLVDYARNPRKNDQVIPKMKASIMEFGFRIPIVAKSDGTVIDGHLRLKAARELGLETVPVVLADELSDTQVKAFRLLANQSANWAEWDDELLKLEMDDLVADGFNVDIIGFDDAMFSKGTMLMSEPEPSEKDYEKNSGEVDLGDFEDDAFAHECPRCKFRFND